MKSQNDSWAAALKSNEIGTGGEALLLVIQAFLNSIFGFLKNKMCSFITLIKSKVYLPKSLLIFNGIWDKIIIVNTTLMCTTKLKEKSRFKH